MDNERNPLYDFIMDHTKDGKKEEMAELLKEALKPPDPAKFDPEAMKKTNEAVLSLVKPEFADEVSKRMDPFYDDSGKPPEVKNMLIQPNRMKWKDSTPKFSADEMRKASECAKEAHNMQCECWNTHCPVYGNCKACIVFHLYMKQFPTCQRTSLGELEEHYIKFSRDK